MKPSAKDNRFLIVTGLSGSGKTVVSRALEDFGYYCVDNLPAKLIGSFVDLWLRKKVEIDRVALVVDIREPRFLADFPGVLREIRKRAPVRLIFLEATDEALAKRFNETRRPHPMAPRKPILEGVRLERKRLLGIRKMADDVVDTSGLNIYQLKDLIAERVLRRRRPRTQVAMTSFGYKHGLPLESDIVFDTRLLPNPFYVERLRTRTGKTPSVRRFVLGLAGDQALSGPRLPPPRLRPAPVRPGGQDDRGRGRGLHRRPAPLGRRRRGAPGPSQEGAVRRQDLSPGPF